MKGHATKAQFLAVKMMDEFPSIRYKQVRLEYGPRKRTKKEAAVRHTTLGIWHPASFDFARLSANSEFDVHLHERRPQHLARLTQYSPDMSFLIASDYRYRLSHDDSRPTPRRAGQGARIFVLLHLGNSRAGRTPQVASHRGNSVRLLQREDFRPDYGLRSGRHGPRR